MGAFYNSICLPGDRRAEARAALSRWLATRGFELADDPPLFDLDPEHERCAYVIHHGEWTVICFSAHEEEGRLIHELQNGGGPLLYVWVYDSMTWGYDLFEGHRMAGSFSSDPAEHLPFAELALGSAERPEAAPQAIGELLGRPRAVDALAALHRRREMFKEDVCRDFCALFDVEPAMVSYEELESGAAPAIGGWRVERLLFARRPRRGGAPPVIDLHAQRVTHFSPTAGALETGTIEVPREVLAEIHRVRRRRRRTFRLLRSVSWLARSWRWLLQQLDRLAGYEGRRFEGELGAAADRKPTFRIEGDDMRNDRHGCRVSLRYGAHPLPASTKPSSVFAFAVGGVQITCVARRPQSLREVMRRPDGAEILDDRPYRIGPLPARRLLFRLPPGFRTDVKGSSYMGLHVVQAPLALYVFVYRFAHAPRPPVEDAIERTIGSLRVDPVGG